jgi:vancomycin resistance protein VanJ
MTLTKRRSVQNSRRPGSKARQFVWRSHPWLFSILSLYLMSLLCITVANTLGPERWWWSSLNLYLPQWIWAVPSVVLLPFIFAYMRRWTWVPICCLLYVFGPLMGFCYPLSLSKASIIPGRSLRVMTYNVKWGKESWQAIVEHIRENNPDLALFQDAGTGYIPILQKLLPGWHIRGESQYIILSRLPIVNQSYQTIVSPLGDFPSTILFRCDILLGKQIIPVYDLHLLSPRVGLNDIRYYKEDGIDGLLNNVDRRVRQAAAVAQTLKNQRGPYILAGDLNAPVQSLVCRVFNRIGLHDAFSETGVGYGYTYGHDLPLHYDFMRIDHIMLSEDWQAIRSHAGSSLGSQHCPVFADIILRKIE